MVARVNIGTIGHSDKRLIIVGDVIYRSTLIPSEGAIVYSPSTDAPLPPACYKDIAITSGYTTDQFIPRTRSTGKCKLCGKFQSDVEDHERRCPKRFRVIHKKRK